MRHMLRLVVPLVVGVAAPLASGSAAWAVDDQNCSDFPSQAAAQQHLRNQPSDPDNLDGDGNGIACETNPAPYDFTPVGQSPPSSPGNPSPGSPGMPTFPTMPPFPSFPSIPTPSIPGNLGFTPPTAPSIIPSAGSAPVAVTTTTVATRTTTQPKATSAARLPETGSATARAVVAALCILWLGWMAVVAGAPLRRSRGASAVARAFRA